MNKFKIGDNVQWTSPLLKIARTGVIIEAPNQYEQVKVQTSAKKPRTVHTSRLKSLPPQQ